MPQRTVPGGLRMSLRAEDEQWAESWLQRNFGKKWTERTRSRPGGGRPRGPRRRVAAVGRDGVSLSIPRADGLGMCGPRGHDPYREVGGPEGSRRRVAAVGRDGVSLSIPRADGLGTCGPRGFDPDREVGGPGGARRRVRAGDAGSGDAGLQGDVADWWRAVGPVPSPGGLEGGRFKRVPTAGDGIRN
jgi:hypothetical protein